MLPAHAKSRILALPGLWMVLAPLRFARMLRHAWPHLALSAKVALRSRELCNHSYRNTEASNRRLAVLLASATGTDEQAVLAYCVEIDHDEELQAVYRAARRRERRLLNLTDGELRPGRQLLHYCLARITKPRLVFEAGTAHGIGSLLLLRALQRNAGEGHPGKVITADINPHSGGLLRNLPPGLAPMIERHIDDSERVLQAVSGGIDLFIHDTVNDAGHERRHAELAAARLTPQGVICTTWGAAGTLAAFSAQRGRRYMEFTNEAQDHWCSDTLGLSLPLAKRLQEPVVLDAVPDQASR